MLLECKTCKKMVEFEQFGCDATRCRDCENARHVKLWAEKKNRAIAYLGSKCKDCGYTGHTAVFDFHHRDPKEKDVVWVQLRSRKWQKITQELDKCDLLCANCHRIRHNEDRSE